MINKKVVFLNNITKVARMFGIETLMTCGRMIKIVFCQKLSPIESAASY